MLWSMEPLKKQQNASGAFQETRTGGHGNSMFSIHRGQRGTMAHETCDKSRRAAGQTPDSLALVVVATGLSSYICSCQQCPYTETFQCPLQTWEKLSPPGNMSLLRRSPGISASAHPLHLPTTGHTRATATSTAATTTTAATTMATTTATINQECYDVHYHHHSYSYCYCCYYSCCCHHHYYYYYYYYCDCDCD